MSDIDAKKKGIQFPKSLKLINKGKEEIVLTSDTSSVKKEVQSKEPAPKSISQKPANIVNGVKKSQ